MHVKMRFTHHLLVPPQNKGSSCKCWRNISHSKGKECKEEQGQDQDKVAAEEERKQRGGSFRDWTDCTETGGAIDLGGRDWSGFQWSQEAVGDSTVCDCYNAGMDGRDCYDAGTCCPHSAANPGPRKPEEEGTRTEEAKGLEGQG